MKKKDCIANIKYVIVSFRIQIIYKIDLITTWKENVCVSKWIGKSAQYNNKYQKRKIYKQSWQC